MKRLLTAAAAAACTVLTLPLPVQAETYDVRAQPATPSPGQAPPATLELDTLQPRVVTGDGDGKLVVAGKLTNTGDRKISDLVVRLQAGAPLTSEDKVSEALSGDAPTDRADTKFTRVGTDLDPGQSVPVRVETPLSALQVSTPGVYPVLFNVNGTPAFGKQARVAARGFLLPVTGVPGGTGLGTPANAPLTTVLWPIVDVPQIVPASGRTVLTSDDLARSVTTGGRLSELVSAVEQTAPPGSALAASMCLVIDPDLVQTVTAMADTADGTYRIRSGRTAVDGTGATAAQKWLERLKGIARGRCVLALPYADADLVALSRAGLADLEKVAVDRSRAVGELLQVQTVTDVVWPQGGVLDERTLADLGRKTLLLDPRAVQDGRTVTSPAKLAAPPDTAASGSSVVPVDALVQNALAGGHAPASGSATYGALDLQNGMGALLYRANALGKNGGSLVVAPPRRWKAPVAELTAFLQSMQQYLAAKLVQPRGLTEQANAAAGSNRTVGLTYPVDATNNEVAPGAVAELRGMRDRSRDLLASMSSDGVKATSPAQLVEPLELGMVRAASGAWRGNPSAGNAAASLVGDELDGLVGQVRIVQPPGPYYLGSSDSPLPLTVSNKLPVRIRVRITFTSTQGLRTSDLNDIEIGANSNLPVRVPLEVVRGGQFSVDALLQTIKGTPLGPAGAPNRITLISTAYGTITLIVTATAGLALVLLVARRLIRRLRSGKEERTA
ncbi:hypothetical protein JOF53_004416 [Crossiella equi]|uniref:Glycoprotein n=1 Tax=Crossiella equi TaxID=130796 RepID=A0ABS5AG33_9PSEU|nr:DUF6049 family protein [Crossiella equi]MBP2475544.1 hypothetical protein [Crossiella equi]